MGDFDLKKYQCKNCRITGYDSEGDTLTLNCLNRYSKAKVYFKGVSGISDTDRLTGSVIDSIEQVKNDDGTTTYLLNLQDSDKCIEIVAEKEEYSDF